MAQFTGPLLELYLLKGQVNSTKRKADEKPDLSLKHQFNIFVFRNKKLW